MARRVFEFFPRFATLRGAADPGQEVVSQPVDVSDGAELSVEALLVRSAGLPHVDWRLESSNNLQDWEERRAGTLTVGDPAHRGSLQPGRHVRVRIVVRPEGSLATLCFEGVAQTG